MKKNRQHKILELIAKYEIDTQDELIDYLEKEGFAVTQATVSRDIRELDIVKVTTSKGTYKYTASRASSEGKRTASLASALVDCVYSVNFAQNIIVLKTTPGMSNPVAVAIDKLDESRILGCVAGDDTILVATRNETAAKSFSERIRIIMKAG